MMVGKILSKQVNGGCIRNGFIRHFRLFRTLRNGGGDERLLTEFDQPGECQKACEQGGEVAIGGSRHKDPWLDWVR